MSETKATFTMQNIDPSSQQEIKSNPRQENASTPVHSSESEPSDFTESHFSSKLAELKGPIDYTLLNDVVFHLAMERAPMISLRGLLSDLMEIPYDEITDVQVLNPIMQEGPKSKKIILDVLAEINHSQITNIELQTYVDAEWLNRSLYYLCREFSKLNAGEDYTEINPAMHISIMTYTIFPEIPEFYARYRLLNIKNHNQYTPHFALNVLDLSKDYMATERDHKNHLDYWAKMFKCKTWEEIRALAAEGPIYKEVAESMAISNTNQRESDWAREHNRYISGMHGSYLAGQMSMQPKIDVLASEVDKLTSENDKLTSEIGKLTSKNDILSEELANKDAYIKSLEARLASSGSM